MKTGAELIAEERQRQIEVEGYNQEHDLCHSEVEFLTAASSYMMPNIHRPMLDVTNEIDSQPSYAVIYDQKSMEQFTSLEYYHRLCGLGVNKLGSLHHKIELES